MPNPIVSKLQLGLEMRRLRLSADVTREQAAKAIDCDVSKISKLESGKISLKTLEVAELCRLYLVAADEVDMLQKLASAARSRSTFRVPDWAQKFAGLEEASSQIRTFQNELVPGLMQTEDYMREVILAANPLRPTNEVDRLIAGRLARQRKLTNGDPFQLTAIVNEAVIRRQVGSRAVMRAQLERLLDLAAMPAINLHILQFTAGAHAAMGSSFVLLYLAPPIDVQVVYLEDLLSSDYLDQPEEVRAYSLTFERLLGSALNPAGSVTLINQALHDL